MNKHSRKLAIVILFAAILLPVSAHSIVINEIRIDQPGRDINEYFELAGSPGESLDGLSYLVIGDSTGGGSGVIEAAIDLNGWNIPADGYFLAAESSFSLAGSVDLTTPLNFENSDNLTHLLVAGFTGILGIDLDSDDDGLLNITPWDTILDAVALIESIGTGEFVYSSNFAGPTASQVPSHIFRSPDSSGSWNIGQFDLAGGVDTPGTPNTASVPEPATLTLLGLGLAGMLVRRNMIARRTHRYRKQLTAPLTPSPSGGCRKRS